MKLTGSCVSVPEVRLSQWIEGGIYKTCIDGLVALDSHRKICQQIDKARIIASQGDALATVGTAGSSNKLEMGRRTGKVFEWPRCEETEAEPDRGFWERKRMAERTVRTLLRA